MNKNKFACDAYGCDTSVRGMEMFDQAGFIHLYWMGKSKYYCSFRCLGSSLELTTASSLTTV